MAITATIDDTTVISATVNATSPIEGSLSQGNQPTVTRVTVPGPQGPSGASTNQISDSSDLDATTIANGVVLQYRSSDNKWVTRAPADIGVPNTIEQSTDVNVSTLVNGMVLQYNSSEEKWVSVDASTLNTKNTIAQSTDVDASSLNDGALLQYRSSDNKWVARNEIETLTGSLAFNGGNF